MSERHPLDEDDWQRRIDAIAAARAAVGEALQLGTIKVGYDGDYAARGSVWVRADCSECGSARVMSATHRLHLGFLALQVARYDCVGRGHQQDMEALGQLWAQEVGTQSEPDSEV